MYILTIHYPNTKGATFDFDYFHQQHLPQVGIAFRPYGLGWATVMRGEESVDGSPPAFFATTVLSFPTEEAAREAVASEAAKALNADVSNFTSAKPRMQFNTSVK
jgi:uncharacterized protein (TIGR02118 family)